MLSKAFSSLGKFGKNLIKFILFVALINAIVSVSNRQPIAVIESTVKTDEVSFKRSWESTEHGIAADFPSLPTEKVIDLGHLKVTDFEHIAIFEGGGARLSITVNAYSELPDISDAALLTTHDDQYVKSLGGVLLETRKSKLEKSSDNNLRNVFAFDFVYSDVLWHTLGFWCKDDNRVVKVSASFPADTSQINILAITDFLKSFIFLDR